MSWLVALYHSLPFLLAHSPQHLPLANSYQKAGLGRRASLPDLIPASKVTSLVFTFVRMHRVAARARARLRKRMGLLAHLGAAGVTSPISGRGSDHNTPKAGRLSPAPPSTPRPMTPAAAAATTAQPEKAAADAGAGAGTAQPKPRTPKRPTRAQGGKLFGSSSRRLPTSAGDHAKQKRGLVAHNMTVSYVLTAYATHTRTVSLWLSHNSVMSTQYCTTQARSTARHAAAGGEHDTTAHL